MTCFSCFVEWIVNFLYSASCKHFRALYTIIEFWFTESTVSVSKLQCAAPSNGFFSFFSTPLKQPKTEREQKVKRKLALGQLVHNRRNHQKGILSKNVDAADSSTKESEVISLKMFQLFWLICNYHFIDWLKRFHVLQCLSPQMIVWLIKSWATEKDIYNKCMFWGSEQNLLKFKVISPKSCLYQ